MGSIRKSREESIRMIQDAPLRVFFKDESQLYNPLTQIPEYVVDKPELYFTWLLSQPDYFYLTCKELFNITIDPMQGVFLKEMWTHKFPMLVASRGASKSFTLALYALLRIIFLKNRKVVICGSGFRQSKIIFNYMESIIQNSPILRNIITPDDITHDNAGYVMRCGNSSALAIPIGIGDKIRGLRANDVICDEFSSVPVDIFETVIAGFASVSASPTENVARVARRKMAQIVGFSFADDKEADMGNQIIISGTAYYSFNHFSAYHERYKKFIKSRGDKTKLENILGKDLRDFNYKDYCIIRIPVELVPEGFMDAAQVARARGTVHSGIYQMEYGAVFSADSNGFYKRTLIESCVVKPDTDIMQPTGNIIPASRAAFQPKLNGDKRKEYVMGIDPAMTQDNFSIVILEIEKDHRKVVYCWTTNKKDHTTKLKSGMVTENNYYAYCACKIRSLMERFNIVNIAIDSQGGGRSVLESLNDKNLLTPGEIAILPIIDYSKPQDTDGQNGLHIIDVINFTQEDWTSKSNHGLRKDMEDKVLLFPYFDSISFAESELSENLVDNEDKFERCVEEIEELKNELSTITVTQTPATNRERWDTPEFKQPNGRKGRQRKDRYSALLMANMTARKILLRIEYNLESVGGGFATTAKLADDGTVCHGPAHIVQQLSDLYSGFGVYNSR